MYRARPKPSFSTHRAHAARYVTNNSTVGTLNRCTRNPVGCKSGRGKKRAAAAAAGKKKTLCRKRIYTHLYRCAGGRGLGWFSGWAAAAACAGGSDREFVCIHIIRTQNKGLCIVTHIFNLENGYPRNNPVAFSSSPSPGPNGRFSFPRVFSSSARTIYLTPVFLTSDALWNRNVPFSFFTSDTTTAIYTLYTAAALRYAVRPVRRI